MLITKSVKTKILYWRLRSKFGKLLSNMLNPITTNVHTNFLVKSRLEKLSQLMEISVKSLFWVDCTITISEAAL